MKKLTLMALIVSLLRNNPELTRKNIVQICLLRGHKVTSILRTYYEAKEVLELEKAKARVVDLEHETKVQGLLIQWLLITLIATNAFFIILLTII